MEASMMEIGSWDYFMVRANSLGRMARPTRDSTAREFVKGKESIFLRIIVFMMVIGRMECNRGKVYLAKVSTKSAEYGKKGSYAPDIH